MEHTLYVATIVTVSFISGVFVTLFYAITQIEKRGYKTGYDTGFDNGYNRGKNK
ncbi:hypothetical protein [Pelosinus sp. UFO1]|uniref:hypothetical protein n=1 Tax=Pelosinus sp. UFO1 TaxID=484770 RepID=UPI0004D183CD|nr:hypothetical protein [Pelosinus sp. UFO1]AIF52043.1 hypothetical protein UFO1_2496 [Pelosinus sp. UFO1]